MDLQTVLVPDEVYRALPWADAIGGWNGESVFDLHSVFERMADARIASKDFASARVLALLSRVCFMMLAPTSNAPFRPMWSVGAAHSALPADLTDSDVQILGATCDVIPHPRLVAQVADVVWVTKKADRGYEYARLAIRAYIEAAHMLGREHLVESSTAWRRGLQLARGLGKAGKLALEEIKAEIVSLVLQENIPPSVAIRYAGIVEEFELDPLPIESIAESLVRCAPRSTYLLESAEALAKAARWYERLDLLDKSADCMSTRAGLLLDEGKRRTAPMGAAGCIEDAIQSLREIPSAQRERHNVMHRLTEARALLREVSQAAVDGLHTFQSEPFDVSVLANSARERVGGRSLWDALFAFGAITATANFEQLEESSKALMKEFPLSAAFSAIYYSHDGRAQAKVPGATPLDAGSEEYSATLWAKVVESYLHDVRLRAVAEIFPAFFRILEEHSIDHESIAEITRLSAVIPRARIELFSHGLWLGFERDFAGALYVLTPQLEHLVRHHLKAAGAITTAPDSNGIDQEVGLSALVSSAAAQRIFQRDLRLEIKALYCDPLGPNLRNAVAHGLLSYDESTSAVAFYAWFFCFRLTAGYAFEGIKRRAAT